MSRNPGICQTMQIHHQLLIKRLIDKGIGIINKGTQNKRCHHHNDHFENFLIGFLFMPGIMKYPSFEKRSIHKVKPYHK